MEDHTRIAKTSLNKETCNVEPKDSALKCLDCNGCLFSDNHDLCVLHYINGVNNREKQPIVVPISVNKPKRTMNQSVATSLKK